MNPCLVKHFPAYFLRPRENTCKVFGGEKNGILFIIVVVDCRQSLTLWPSLPASADNILGLGV